MIFFGVFGKFGAVFLTIPNPIIGGVFIVMFGKYIYKYLFSLTCMFRYSNFCGDHIQPTIY